MTVKNVSCSDVIFLDTDSRRLCINNKEICLKNKEYGLMQYFMKNVGKVISRTDILEEVWDRNIFCNTNTVDVHISKLRKKIGEYSQKSVIKTVHSVGYLYE